MTCGVVMAHSHKICPEPPFLVAQAIPHLLVSLLLRPLALPLAGVLGMLELLRLTQLSNEQQELVKIMHGSAEGLIQVTGSGMG